MSRLAERTVEFIERYDGLKYDNEGNITELSLVEFARSLEKFLDRESFNGAIGEVLPYCGGGRGVASTLQSCRSIEWRKKISIYQQHGVGKFN